MSANKKLDIINLAAEFANTNLEITLTAQRESASLVLEGEDWREVAELHYWPGVAEVTIWSWNGRAAEGDEARHSDTSEGWIDAKVAFRQAVLDHLREEAEAAL